MGKRFFWESLVVIAAFRSAAVDWPLAYRERWDEQVGLWTHHPIVSPGQTSSSHWIRDNAWMLVSAGFDGLLRELPTGRVLARLREAQVQEGPEQGGFWWAWEDRRIKDANSGFFTVLGLLVLRHEFYDSMGETERSLLEALLRTAQPWFRRRTEPLTEAILRYPNRCLGDLVCRWLLMERFDSENDPPTEEALRKALRYLQESHWGWGEHLSDLYAKVCQGALTALLAYGRRLPNDVVSIAERLWQDLEAIDAAYAGGPRVPTIRCYALAEPPGTHMPGVYRPWRDLMVPWGPEHRRGSFGVLAVVAHAHGLHRRFPVSSSPRSPSVEVPCYGGTRALAAVTPSWRMGVMTRYPLMKGVDHRAWGLHWQSMPVAFAHQAGDWAFLQWEAEEDGTMRALPAFQRDNLPSRVLSDVEPAAAVGHTFGWREGEVFLVLRRMEAVSPRWSYLTDRFRILGSTWTGAVETREGPWRGLNLSYDGLTLRMGYCPLEGEPQTSWYQSSEGAWHWDHRYAWDKNRSVRPAGLWLLQMSGAAIELPDVTLRDGVGRVRLDADRLLPFRLRDADPWGTDSAGQNTGRMDKSNGGERPPPP